MILVTVGTNEARFDRLLGAVGHGPDGEEVIVQHGPSPIRPPGALAFDFLPYEALLEYATAARHIVAHAGAGSILMAAQAGKRPIVMARLQRYGEAVDDHQLAFAQRLDDAGLVDLVSDPVELWPRITDRTDRQRPTVRAGGLGSDLRAYLLETLGPPRPELAGDAAG
jgi:UDP-N-acetylglucosamine transferase subunit ALG13